MKNVKLTLVAAAMLLAVSGPASAGTTTTNLNVSVTVVPVCTVSTTPVNFGSTTGAEALFAEGAVAVTCPQFTDYRITMDAGTHYLSGWRNLTDGTGNGFWYGLYKSAGYLTTDEWGDSGFGNTYLVGTPLISSGTGAPQSHVIYGYLLNTVGSPTAGTYTDTVLVTVHY